MEYYEQNWIWKAKYIISFHNWIKKHLDGSKFFDIKIFKNKKAKNLFIKNL